MFAFVKWIEWSFAEEAEEFRKALAMAEEMNRADVIAPVAVTTSKLQRDIEKLRDEVEELRVETLKGREKEAETKAGSEKPAADCSSRTAPG
jgi:hydroxyethylthiazole kinase-like sugar kinase family protein